MVERILFVGLVSAALIAGSAATSEAVGDPADARTLATFPGVTRAVASDGRRLARIETTWELRLRTLRSGAQRTVRYTSQYEESPDGPQPRLVLGAGRALWVSVRGAGMGGMRVSVLTTAAAGSRVRKLAVRQHSAEFVGFAGLVAGEGDHLAFASSRAEVETFPCEVCTYAITGGVWTLDGGRSRRVPGVPASALLARAGERLAVAPAQPTSEESPAFVPAGPVELRHARSGAVLRSVTPAQSPVALALSPQVLAVLVGPRAPTRIERYDPATGRLIGSTPVSREVAKDLDVAGTTIVFHDTRTLRRLDARTGRATVLARAPRGWRVVDVDVSGTRVVWAESFQKNPFDESRRTARSRIRAIPLD